MNHPRDHSLFGLGLRGFILYTGKTHGNSGKVIITLLKTNNTCDMNLHELRWKWARSKQYIAYSSIYIIKLYTPGTQMTLVLVEV